MRTSHPLAARAGQLLLSGVLLVALSGAAIPSSRAAEPARPNILFLLSDDHSYPYLSTYGDPNVRTPTLDRLASEGMKFHRFFTAAPQCVPSRAALLTGRSPVAARITRFSSPLPREEITFPEILRKEAGYFVGVGGRGYHLDGPVGGNRGGVPGELLQKHALQTFRERFDYVNSGPDRATVAQMTEFLGKKPEGKPFFLWMNFSDPHHPWEAQAEAPDPASLKLPAHWPDLPGVRRQFADYCGEVNRLDASVKAILDLLQSKGLAENTIVVFAGDNGAALPHGKGSLYDPGSNVPFLVRWPGVVKPGGESKALVSGEDLAPTLLEAVGAKVPERISGKSILPLLKGQTFTPRKHLFIERGPHGSAPVTETIKSSGYDLSRAVRSDRFKLIYNCTPWVPYSPVDSAGGAGWREITEANVNGTLAEPLRKTYFTTPRPVYELYDLDADPSELNNVFGKPEHAAVQRELLVAMTEKMILDYDYLPLPAIPAGGGAAAQNPGNMRQQRAALFQRLDKDGDGRLTKAEFSADRAPAEAERWFTMRDVNRDGFISREEFQPGAPLTKPETEPAGK